MDDAAQLASPAPGYPQLAQVRVDLAEAAEVFARPDASGRIPIVLLPQSPHRIRNDFLVVSGAAAIAGVILLLLGQAPFAPVAFLVAAVFLVLAVLRAFMVTVPEGTTALLARGGRYLRAVGPGVHRINPFISVSHLINRREVPYDAPVQEAVTADGVRATVDTALTFAITDPYRFIYGIGTESFDQVFQAACQEALRSRVRRVSSDGVADLAQRESEEVRAALNAVVEPYGVSVMRVMVTDARPPETIIHSQEARQLAAVQRLEQSERQALAQQRQANQDALLRQELLARLERERETLETQLRRIEARRQVVALEAEVEAQRLARLEERLRSYPLAARWDWDSAQLEVARALAGNTRAILQVGGAGDIARALMLGDDLRGRAPVSAAGAEIAPFPAPAPPPGGSEPGAAEPETADETADEAAPAPAAPHAASVS